MKIVRKESFARLRLKNTDYKFASLLLLTLFLLSFFLSGIPPSTPEQKTQEHDYNQNYNQNFKTNHNLSSKQSDPYIVINSDDELNASFPSRIISGFNIDTSYSRPCIYIGNCSYPFVIENCVIERGNSSGIEINNCSNAILRYNQFSSCAMNSISVFLSNNISIYENVFVNLSNTVFYTTDILVRYSINCSISTNDISNTNYGIVLFQSVYCTVENNHITNASAAMWNDRSNNTLIIENNINCSDRGILVVASNCTRLSYNYIANSYNFTFNSPIVCDHSTNFTIDNNTILQSENGIGVFYTLYDTFNALIENNYLESSSNIPFDEFDYGIVVSPLFANYATCIIKNCTSSGFENGFIIRYVKNGGIFNCDASDCPYNGLLIADSYDFTISNNNIYNSKNGTQIYHSKNITYEYNYVSDSSSAFYGSELNNSIIRNNDFYNSSSSTLILNLSYNTSILNNTLNSAGANFTNCLDCKFINNTIYDSKYLFNAEFSRYINISNNNFQAFETLEPTSENCKISNEIKIHSCEHSSLYSNIIENAHVVSSYSNSTKIISNQINALSEFAILLDSSRSNTISDNSMNRGIFLEGNAIYHFNEHDISTSNLIYASPIRYFKNQTSLTNFPSHSAQIILANCSSSYLDSIDFSNVARALSIYFSYSISVSNCNFYDCNAGIYLFKSDNTIIDSNSHFDGYCGISVNFGTAQVRNNFILNSTLGIVINNCLYSTFSNNTMNNSSIFFDPSSTLECWLSCDISQTNTVNSKTVYLIRNQTSGSPPNNAGEILIANSTNLKIDGYNITNTTVAIQCAFSSYLEFTNNSISYANFYAIYLASCNNSLIKNNIIKYSNKGIFLLYCRYNTITENIVYSCTRYALEFSNGSTTNYIYLNNFISNNNVSSTYNSNKSQAFQLTTLNTWINILNQKGNFWSDLRQPDSDSNGIIDIRYNIDTKDSQPSYDPYPLARPYGNAMLPISNIISITPNPATFGENITFVGSGIQQFGTIIAYYWADEFANLLSTNASFTTSDLSPGIHIIQLMVQDDFDLWSAPASAFLTVNPSSENMPPTASISYITPSPAISGQIISFSGSGFDPDGSIIAYNWSSNISGFLSNSPYFTTSSLPEGTHLISFSVQDNNGSWSSPVFFTLIIQPYTPGTNLPPSASISFITPSPAISGQIISFSGSGFDPDGFIIAYNWSSNISGFLSDSSSFTTSSLPEGTHLISFSVQDNNGSWSSPVFFTLIIQPYTPGTNLPPTASISYITPSPAISGQIISFSGSGSDPDGSIIAYNWSSNISGFLSNSHSFTTSSLPEGTHLISFSVQDNNGSWSVPATFTLTITIAKNAKPIAQIINITPKQTSKGNKISFSGYGLDSDGSIIEYKWVSSIDGIIGTLPNFTINNLSLGSHNISFSVKDNAGDWSDFVTAYIKITDKAPQSPFPSYIPILAIIVVIVVILIVLLMKKKKPAQVVTIIEPSPLPQNTQSNPPQPPTNQFLP